MHDVSEIQIIPIKAKNGLVGYASFVLDKILYFSSIGIITRPQGGFRLLFPTKDFATGVSKIFYPINKEFAYSLESKIADKFREVTGL